MADETDPTTYGATPEIGRSGSSRSRSSATSPTTSAGPEKSSPALGSDDDGDDTSDNSSSDGDYDGHRPSRSEMRPRHRTCSTATTVHPARPVDDDDDADDRPAHPSASGSLTRALSRRSTTIIARIRSRPTAAVQQFTHPLSHVATTPDVLVDFDSASDPYKPLNWPLRKKVATTLLYGLVTMSATWASSCYAPGTAQVAAEFGVPGPAAVLGTSLYMAGFGIGPLLWAPLSEVYGRRPAVFAPMLAAVCFSFGSGASKDFAALMLTRFFGALFASAPVTNTGGVLGDLFGPAQRGFAMAGYAMAVVAGPALGMSALPLEE